MSDDDETGGEERKSPTPPPSAAKPPRKKRSDAGTKRGSGGSRFSRRAEKATQTVRELVRIRMPELDVSELSFVETVDRDADAWGDFLAQLGEWVEPFGVFLDLVFGVALIRVLRIAPSFRAGRRDLSERRQRIAEERAAYLEEEALRQQIAEDHEQARTEGVFGDHPPMPDGEEPEPELTREQWLARARANGGE